MAITQRGLIRLLILLGFAISLGGPTATPAATTVTAWGDNTYGQLYVPAGLSNAVAVAAGAGHSLALRADGTVIAWGCNTSGETNVPAGLNNGVAVAADYVHNLALRSDGTVVAWGWNPYGQTNVPAGLSNVVAVAVGEGHNLALRSDGTVVAWGWNSYGQANVPAGLTNAVAVAAGYQHSLALRADGTVVAWGYNTLGQTNVPAGLSNIVAVAAGGYHSLVVRADGTVVAWGSIQEVPVGLSNIVAVAAGEGHNLALRSDGTVIAWGSIQEVPLGLSNVVAVAAGRDHNLALGGTLAPFLNAPLLGQIVPVGTTATFRVSVTANPRCFYQWRMNGTNLPGATNITLVLTNVALSQAGSYSVIVSNSLGTVTSGAATLTVVPLVIKAQPESQTAFPGNSVSLSVGVQSILPVTYQWRLGTTNLLRATNSILVLTNVAVSQAGNYSVLVSNSAGSVVSAQAVLTVLPLAAWGRNQYGQTNVPSGLSNVVAVAAGEGHSLTLRADGTVVAWGWNQYGQTNVPAGLSNVVAVAGGGYHSLALKADGTVGAWGYFGQANVPGGLNNVAAVAAGLYHSLALRSDGTVVVWGNNVYGELNVPTGLNNVSAVATMYSHNLALRADGTVVAWGWNSYGQTNVPAGLSNAVAVAAGYQHSLALRADGTVVAWGYNWLGQTNVPASLSNVVAVAAGANHSLALRTDGNVVVWGDYGYGQTNVPASLSNVVAVTAGWYHNLALSGGLAPFLNAPLLGQIVLVGANVTFRVGVSASRPYFYQWQMNGTNLPGATSNPLILTNVSLSQAGNYSVMISNSLGTVTSSAATLTVVPLIINTQPQSQTSFPRGTASFFVDCQSVLPVTYQWRLAGTNLPGATSNPLVLTNVTMSQAGAYSVIVSNSAGWVASAKGVLTVVPVAAWGNDDYSQTSIPIGLSNVVAVSAGVVHSVALQSDDTVVAWGDGRYGQTNLPSGLSNSITVAAGGWHSLVLRSNGTIMAWGDNTYGQTNVPVGLSNVVAIAGGGVHSLALRSNGTVVAWGSSFYGQTNVPIGLSNVVGIAAGNWHSLALKADGSVVAWGDNEFNQGNVPASVTNVVAITAGGEHSVALMSDDSVVVWGGGGSPAILAVPSEATNVVAVSAGGYYDYDLRLIFGHSLALRADGAVVAWGSGVYGQTDVPSWVTGAGSVAGGRYHSLAGPAIGAPFVTSRLASRVGSPGGTVSFRVEANGARPLRYQWRRNGVDLLGGTNAVLQLTGVTSSDEGDYSVVVSNALGVATIPPARLSVTRAPLQLALDDNLPWSTGGASAWFVETTQTHDGVDAAQSGAIANNQETWLGTSVVGPGSLTYWWKVSSEPGYDFLEFYRDGVLQPGKISGEVPWQKQTYSILSGAHTIRWRYVKDVADSAGQDAGWLDEVLFVPTLRLSAELANGSLHLQIANASGQSVDLERVPGIEVYATTNLSLNMSNWVRLTNNLVLTNGLMLLADPEAALLRRRFYRALEKP